MVYAPSRSVKTRRRLSLRGGAREGEHARAKEEEQIRRGRPHVEAACWLGRKGSAATNMWLPTIGSRIEWLDIKSGKSMAKRAWAVVMGTFGGLYPGAMTTDLENSCCI